MSMAGGAGHRPINQLMSVAGVFDIGARVCGRFTPCTIGALHRRVSRVEAWAPAFALDLMEPFRPLIADSVAITCFNRGELTEGISSHRRWMFADRRWTTEFFQNVWQEDGY